MLKNVLANWSNLILSILAVFILYPYCVQVLGEEQYGVWLLISSLTGYFALLQLGVPMANVRFVSKYLAQGDMDKVNEVVSTNFAFFTVVGLIVLLAGIGSAWLLDIVFKVPGEFKRVARFALIIVSANIAFSFAFEVYEGVLHALQRFTLVNLVKNSLLLVRVAATFLILKFENGLFVLSLLLLVVTLLQGVVFYVYIKSKHSLISISLKNISCNAIRSVVGYSVFVLIFQFASKISFNTDAIIIGSAISVSAIVFFTIGNNFILYFTQLITGISKVVMPRVSELDALGDRSSIQKMYLQYSRLTSFLITPVCMGFFIFGGDFIAIWMGEKYRLISGNVLSILTISYLFFLTQRGVAYPILMGTSCLRFPTILMTATSLLNVVLSIWWGKVYGLYGVAWGTTVPNLINVAGIIWFMCRTFKVPIIPYLYRGLVLPLSAGVFFGVPAVALREYVSIDSYGTFSLVLSISSLIYLLSIFILHINNDQKRLWVNKLGLSHPK